MELKEILDFKSQVGAKRLPEMYKSQIIDTNWDSPTVTFPIMSGFYFILYFTYTVDIISGVIHSLFWLEKWL